MNVVILVVCSACLLCNLLILLILGKLSDILGTALTALSNNPLAGLFSNDITAATRDK